MSKNVHLVSAIAEAGLRQYELAALTGLNETRISRIICGRRAPTRFERRAISRALGLPQKQLFPELRAGAQ